MVLTQILLSTVGEMSVTSMGFEFDFTYKISRNQIIKFGLSKLRICHILKTLKHQIGRSLLHGRPREKLCQGE